MPHTENGTASLALPSTKTDITSLEAEISAISQDEVLAATVNISGGASLMLIVTGQSRLARPRTCRHSRNRRAGRRAIRKRRSEEHTSELQSLMRTPYAVFCLKKKTKQKAN